MKHPISIVGLVILFLVSTPLFGEANGPSPETGATGRGTSSRTGQQPGPGVTYAPAVLWTALIGGRQGLSPETSEPVVSGDTVYVAGGDGQLVAFDIASGAEKWRFEIGGGVGVPTVVGGVVYVGSGYYASGGYLYALDAATGDQKWKFPAKDKMVPGMMPAVENGTVFFVSVEDTLRDPDTFVFAVDAATGEQQWRFEIKGVYGTSVAVAKGMVYVCGGEGELFAINAATGKQSWKFKGFGSSDSTTPVVAGSSVYVNNGDGLLYAINVKNGKKRWTFESSRGNGRHRLLYAPTIADGQVIVPSEDDHIYAADAATGAERWNVAVPNGLFAEASVVDGLVYIGGPAGGTSLSALDASNGAELWSVVLSEFGSPIDHSPSVVGSVVYLSVITGDGAELIALG